MTTGRLVALIGVMFGVGMMVVAVQNAVWMKAYDLGRRHDAFTRTDVRATWLEAEVRGLSSPAKLVDRLSNGKQKFVAWTQMTHE